MPIAHAVPRAAAPCTHRAILALLAAAMPSVGIQSAMAQPKPSGPPPAAFLVVPGAQSDAAQSEVPLSIDPALITHPSFVKPADRNAAIMYWNAFFSRNLELHMAISKIDWNAVGDNFDAADMHESYKSAAKIGLDTIVLDILHRAASTPHCNWESSFEDGFTVLMPHLGLMRSVAQLVRFAARDAMVAKTDPRRAAEHLVALCAMARHTASDKIIISALIAAHILLLATDESRSLAASGRLTPVARDAIVAALSSFPIDDPLGHRAAVEGERDLVLTWAEHALTSPEARRRLAEEYGAFEPRAAGLAKMSAAQMQADIRKAREAFDLLLTAWDDPHPLPAIRAVNERVKNMEFGIYAAIALPAFDKTLESRNRVRDAVADAIRALEAAAVTPDVAPKSAP